jgi:hypothetical protein
MSRQSLITFRLKPEATASGFGIPPPMPRNGYGAAAPQLALIASERRRGVPNPQSLIPNPE